MAEGTWIVWGPGRMIMAGLEGVDFDTMKAAVDADRVLDQPTGLNGQDYSNNAVYPPVDITRHVKPTGDV